MCLGGRVHAAEARPLRVVATLTTFADLTKTIGGEHVEVASIAPARFNPHFIEPKPSDVLKAKRADVLVHAGLDLELWRGPLLDAAGNERILPGQPGDVDLSRGLTLLEVPAGPATRAEGDIHLYGNPHYWLTPENAQRMAQTICDQLCAIDPAHEPAYRANLKAFLQALEQRMPAWRGRLAPYAGQELVGYHNEWPYLMQFAGLRMAQFLEPKPGIPPTPKQLEFLERHMTEQRIPGIVQATYAPRRAADTLARRTGARVILLCQSVQETAACPDYLAMMDYNLGQLAAALARGDAPE
jgi:ABC-type Zn uptake system ZnuABC Zn-binding protein ZnuA